MSQQTLDRDAFKKRIPVLAVSTPAENASFFLKSQELKGFVLRVVRLRNWLTTVTA